MADVTVTPTLTISATAPASPAVGDLWWNSAIGVFFVYYDDGTSTQWVTTQPVKYINIAELQAPAGGDLTGYFPNPLIEDAVALEFPVLRNPLTLGDYTQRLASTKWVQDMFASFGLLGQITEGPGILLTPNPMAGDSTIALKAISPPIVTGTYGAANETPQITVDIYGRITLVAGVPIPPINSPAFTGIPTAPTAAPGTNTTQIATTAWGNAAISAFVAGTYAPLLSPAFTGTPTAPTAGIPPTTPATQIANTAWVATYFLALTGGTLSGPLVITDPAGLAPFTINANVNNTVSVGIVNTSTGASSVVESRWTAGNRAAYRRVNYTSQYVHDVGSAAGILNYFSDFDSHNFRTLAGVSKLALTTTLAAFALPISSTGIASILTGTAIPAGGTAGAGYLLSSTANFGVIFGSGVPNKAMARGSLYLRSDGPPYYNTDGATTWSPVGGNVTTSDTAPVAPLDGQLWWNSVLGSMFIYYNDGNTSQWVPTTPAASPNNGKLLQSVYVQTGALATGTGLIPADNTIPQITEGDQYMSLVITPQSPTSILVIDVTFNGTCNVAPSQLIVALFRDAVADALATCPINYPASGFLTNFKFTHSMIAGTTSAITFRVRAGCNNAATTTFNGSGGAAQYGGTTASSIVIREVIP